MKKSTTVNVVVAIASCAVMWLTGAAALWYSPALVWGSVKHDQVGAFYASAVIWCTTCAFLQGYILRRRSWIMAFTTWLFAGIAILAVSPAFVYLFDTSYGLSDCSIPNFRFDLDGLMPSPLGIHTHVFVLLILPAIAALAVKNGASYRCDRNPLRLYWIAAVLVLVVTLVMLGEHYLGVNW